MEAPRAKRGRPIKRDLGWLALLAIEVTLEKVDRSVKRQERGFCTDLRADLCSDADACDRLAKRWAFDEYGRVLNARTLRTALSESRRKLTLGNIASMLQARYSVTDPKDALRLAFTVMTTHRVTAPRNRRPAG